MSTSESEENIPCCDHAQYLQQQIDYYADKLGTEREMANTLAKLVCSFEDALNLLLPAEWVSSSTAPYGVEQIRRLNATSIAINFAIKTVESAPAGLLKAARLRCAQ